MDRFLVLYYGTILHNRKELVVIEDKIIYPIIINQDYKSKKRNFLSSGSKVFHFRYYFFIKHFLPLFVDFYVNQLRIVRVKLLSFNKCIILTLAMI